MGADEWGTVTEAVHVLIDTWDRTRLNSRHRSRADREFWNYLAREVPAQAERVGTPLAPDDHCRLIFMVVQCCMSELERCDDALFLLEEVTRLYGRSGDRVAEKVIDSVSEGCGVIGVRPRYRVAAAELLNRLHEPAARAGSARVQRLVALELYELGRLEVLERTPSTFIERTKWLVRLYGDFIRQTRDSRDGQLQTLVAGARNAKARMHMDLGQESAAQREYRAVADSAPFPDEAEAVAEMRAIARHALEVLGTIGFPEPKFHTELLELKRAKNLRGIAFPDLLEAREYAETRRERLQINLSLAGLWVAQFFPGSVHKDQRRRLVRMARTIHNATVNLVRRCACTGDPIVLVLRNFDLGETYAAERNPALGGMPTHVEIHRARKTQPLLQRMAERVDSVTIASTHAGTLELGGLGGGFGRPANLRAIYLPGDHWLDHVRTLITVAERIVVWADGKAPSLLLELDAVEQLGRTDDTVVLLEEHKWDGFTLAFLPEERRRAIPPQLTSDDPVLARFPIVMTVEDAVTEDLDRSPFLAAVLDPVDRVGGLPVGERVAHLRARLRSLRP